jgi:hypothetical protein
MIFKIRVVLDTKEDVIRTLLLENTSNLEDFHLSLVESYEFESGQMASFYQCDSEWNQGEEIPLVNMTDEDDIKEMSDHKLEDLLSEKGHKLLYVYDFLNMWTCFVELIEILETTEHDLPYLLVSVGNTPQEAPEKNFESSKDSKPAIDPFSDEALFGSSFDEEMGSNGFENIDDLDLDKF